MYEYDYDDDEPRRRWWLILVALGAAGVGWFVVRPALGNDDGEPSAAGELVFDAESTSPVTTESVETTLPATTLPDTTLPPETTLPDTTLPATTLPPDTTVPETTLPDTTLPETTLPETTLPETTLTETTLPDTTFPETTLPDTTLPPDTTVPETTLPATTLPATTLPNTTMPATTSTSTTTTSTTTTSVPSPSTTIAAATTATTTTAATTTTPAAAALGAGVTEPRLPDGRPIAVTAVFADDQVTLSGAVPNDAAAAQLLALALDYRLTPAAVVNNVTIDPAIPADAGVRIVELNTINFVDDTAAVTPEHTPQLDRVVDLMNRFPNARVHVVGNTHQLGEPTRNFVVSQRRAEAIVAYLVAQGIDAQRLTTQPGGESNPLSTEVSPAADALNRRTDYVVFGVLGE